MVIYKVRTFEKYRNIESAMSVKSSPSSDILLNYLAPVNEKYLPEKTVKLNQVHGDKIHIIENTNEIDYVNGLDGDGLITTVPDVALSISVADCAPVALFDIDGSAIGLVHSGWRGTEKNIVGKAVMMLIDYRIEPQNIFAYIGPAIGAENYEVGKEFFKNFPHTAFEKDGKIFFDLVGEIERQLKELGISKVEKFPFSTYSTYWLHSYRRDKENAGRNIFYLWKTSYY